MSQDSLLSVLAASVPGGAILVVGVPDHTVVLDLMANMDITTRLLVIAETEKQLNSLRDKCKADLRMSMHAQDFDGFFADIAAHQFSLVICADVAATAVERACSHLEAGGMAVGVGVDAPRENVERVISGRVVQPLSWITTRRARRPPTRRGGRRRHAMSDA